MNNGKQEGCVGISGLCYTWGIGRQVVTIPGHTYRIEPLNPRRKRNRGRVCQLILNLPYPESGASVYWLDTRCRGKAEPGDMVELPGQLDVMITSTVDVVFGPNLSDPIAAKVLRIAREGAMPGASIEVEFDGGVSTVRLIEGPATSQAFESARVDGLDGVAIAQSVNKYGNAITQVREIAKQKQV